MRVLFIASNVPYPVNSGGAIRTWRILEGLTKAFEVTLVAETEASKDLSAFLEKLKLREAILVRRGSSRIAEAWATARRALNGCPVTFSKYAGEAMGAAIASVATKERFDIVHFDHLHSAQLLPLVRTLLPSAKISIDEHNVEWRIADRVARAARAVYSPILAQQARSIGHLERSLVSAADIVLACSSIDADELRALGAKDVRIVPNGVTIPPSSNYRRLRRSVVFVGAQDWWPNADASRILATEIWPRVSSRLGKSNLYIVGRNPPKHVRDLQGSDIRVTGTVKSVDSYLARAWVTAMPLRAGSGTRLKLLEAAAAGVPIIASELAAEGLPFVDGESFVLANTSAEFSESLVRLYRDAGLRTDMANAARRIALSYKWSIVLQDLVKTYRRLVSSSPSSCRNVHTAPIARAAGA